VEVTASGAGEARPRRPRRFAREARDHLRKVGLPGTSDKLTEPIRLKSQT